jgi:hypothetical protein
LVFDGLVGLSGSVVVLGSKRSVPLVVVSDAYVPAAGAV